MPVTKEKNVLIGKLDQLDARFCELEKQIADPAVSGDHNTLIALSKEQGKLRATVSKYRQYKKTAASLEETRQLLNDPSAEEDFKTLAKDEINQLEKKADAILDELLDELLMGDEMSIDSVIVEIRAGTGGDEAALFARDLYNMYTKYADDHKWRIEQLDFSTTERGGFREIVFNIKGRGVWAELRFEGGGHRVQRVPETEAQGRVHTSAATVAILPEPKEIDIQINPSDVVEHVSRAGGPGGQNVNKVSSAIKLEHIPTGITVSMREDKSQHKNRSKAWRILRSRIYEFYQAQERAKRAHQRKTMIGSGDRSEKIRTYNFPQNRMTDHRINLSVYNLDKIIAGDMRELIAALQSYDKQEKLKNL